MSTSTTPLRIVHVDAEQGFSGGEVQVFLLLEGLRARGHENVLVCPPDSPAAAEAARRGFERHTVSMPSHLALGTVAHLTRWLGDREVDLVHTNTGRDAWLAGCAAWRAGLPSITTRRMDRRIKRGPRTRWTYRTFADRVVAISPGVQQCLEEAHVPAEHIALIPEAFDPARIAPTRTRAQVRRTLGVTEGDVLVLGLGALHPRKGFDVLLEALALLPDETRARIQVRLAGQGPERGALEERAARLGLSSRVGLLGAREDVGDLLAAADLFAMPSRAEGLGVAALEAMGAARPVVASAVGGLAFSVVEGETGRLVPPEDAPALAAALGALATDAQARGRLGAGARARAESHFRPEAMVEAYERLYRDVLARRRGA